MKDQKMFPKVHLSTLHGKTSRPMMTKENAEALAQIGRAFLSICTTYEADPHQTLELLMRLDLKSKRRKKSAAIVGIARGVR